MINKITKKLILNILLGSMIAMLLLSACGNQAGTDDVNKDVANKDAITSEAANENDKVAVEADTEESNQDVTSENENLSTEQASAENAIEDAIKDENSSDDSDDVAADMPASPTVLINGVLVSLGDNMAELEANLGTPDSFESAESCIGVGEDKTYTYGGTIIYTEPRDGKDLVYLINLEESAKLSNGLGLGNTKDEIIAVFGDDYSMSGDYLEYDYDGITLSFEITSDTVTYVEIYR